MRDPRVEKLARVLVEYCVEVKPGDKILLQGEPVARPLMIAAYREVIRAGGLPFVLWDDPEMQEILIKEGGDDQLFHMPEPVEVAFSTYRASIYISGTDNTRTLSNADPARQQLASRAEAGLQRTMQRRLASGEFTFVVTMFPTLAYAQEANMSLREYEDFVFGACFVDRDDPVAAWRKVHQRQQRLVDWLSGKEQVRVAGPHADLTLSIAGRRFLNADGRMNMPSGEIYTSPLEDSADGWVRFTYPAIYAGREVEGVELRFANGKVVDARAAKNEAFLLSLLETDEGASYLGEFAIGTNEGIKQFTKSILFDEKIAGTFHVALGLGFAEVGGKNESAVHWDLICDMRDGGKIWVDDELFYDSGQFLLLR